MSLGTFLSFTALLLELMLAVMTESIWKGHRKGARERSGTGKYEEKHLLRALRERKDKGISEGGEKVNSNIMCFPGSGMSGWGTMWIHKIFFCMFRSKNLLWSKKGKADKQTDTGTGCSSASVPNHSRGRRIQRKRHSALTTLYTAVLSITSEGPPAPPERKSLDVY